MKHSRIIIALILFTCSTHGFASWGDTLIHTNYNDWTFQAMAKHVEQEHRLQFIFRESWVREVNMVQDQAAIPLTDLLEQSLSPHGIFFIIRGSQVILTGKEDLNMDRLESFGGKLPGEPSPASIRYEEILPEQEVEPADRNRLIQIGLAGSASPDKRATLNGYIRESETGEPIIGAVVYNEEEGLGVSSDVNGYYVINLKKGRHLLTYRSMGRREEFRSVIIHGDGSLNLELEEKINQLKGVVITADKYQNVTGLQVGLNKINVQTIKQVPAVMGESDVMKVALLLPGVQSVGEGASGFNVRGGSTDQNLILINKAPVYNTSHLFGFFSSFNPDVIKDFKLYKSGIAAQYGGRISSVFDLTTRQGNRKKFGASGGISPVTGRLVLEGPIIKDKLSFLAGARSTYSDWILNRIPDPAIRNSSAYFYDLNGVIQYELNEKNSLHLSSYYSKDHFRLNSDTSYAYTNANVVADWKHVFSQKLVANFTGIYSSYHYEINSQAREEEAFAMAYQIRHKEFKAAFRYYPSAKHLLIFGADVIHYGLQPGSYQPVGQASLVDPFALEPESGLESALHLSDEFQLSDRLSIYGGIRYSFYAFLGPKTVTTYFEGVPRMPIHVKDTLHYASGEVIQAYHGPEWRVKLRYKTGPRSSVKLSYSRMRQYLNMMSNTTAVSPTDTWKLSDNHLRPQVGDQVALGFYKDFKKQNIESSIEAYYKNITDLVEYKGGARLLLNEALEQDLINAHGRAYGVEVMLERSSGKLNGWVSYTYSRIMVQANSAFPLEEINEGNWFPANHDKPHDLTLVGNYKFTRRLNISSNLTYSTGRPITYPVAQYHMRGLTMLHYTYRNEYRIPDYFRWDLSITLDGNLKSKKLAHSSWTASIYNVTGRDNVYSIYFVSSERQVSGYKLSIFNQPVITLTYNFRF